MKLRVWHIPQIPMKPFYVPVGSVAEAIKILDLLAEYDKFQFENNIKPDYSSVGGLQEFDESDTTDGPDGSWVDWCDVETGIDDPREFKTFCEQRTPAEPRSKSQERRLAIQEGEGQ